MWMLLALVVVVALIWIRGYDDAAAEPAVPADSAGLLPANPSKAVPPVRRSDPEDFRGEFMPGFLFLVMGTIPPALALVPLITGGFPMVLLVSVPILAIVLSA